MEEVPKEGDGLKIQGSAMVALASSKEEVLEALKRDTYAENNVWDFSKVCCPSISQEKPADVRLDPNLSLQVCFP